MRSGAEQHTSLSTIQKQTEHHCIVGWICLLLQLRRPTRNRLSQRCGLDTTVLVSDFCSVASLTFGVVNTSHIGRKKCAIYVPVTFGGLSRGRCTIRKFTY